MADAATSPVLLFTLPAHLRERIAALVRAEIAPQGLQADLRAALEAAEFEEWEEAYDGGDGGHGHGDGDGDGDGGDGTGRKGRAAILSEKGSGESPTDPPRDVQRNDDEGGGVDDSPPSPPPPVRKPPTIDGDVLDRLGAWAASSGDALRAAGLDANEYGPIALLAGTQVYLPPRQRVLAAAAEKALADRDKPNPYLPRYMSPAPPSFGKEYRALSRDLATAANVLFSIGGVGGAAYVAATTGAGWSREHAVLLAIFVGLVTGVADAGLIYIFKTRAAKARRDKAAARVRLNKGSAGIPGSARVVPLDADADADGVGDQVNAENEAHAQKTALVPPPADSARRTLRLRRKPIANLGQT